MLYILLSLSLLCSVLTLIALLSLGTLVTKLLLRTSLPSATSVSWRLTHYVLFALAVANVYSVIVFLVLLTGGGINAH